MIGCTETQRDAGVKASGKRDLQGMKLFTDDGFVFGRYLPPVPADSGWTGSTRVQMYDANTGWMKG